LEIAMGRQPKEPTWPFLCILACLFVLSAAAPRAWEKTIRARDVLPSEEAIAEEEAPAFSEVDVIAQVEDDETATVPQLIAAAPAPAITIIEPLPHGQLTVEKVNGLLMVVPSPRIASRGLPLTEVDLDESEDEVADDTTDTHLTYPQTTESFVAEQMLPEPVEDEEAAEIEVEKWAEVEEAAEVLPEAVEEIPPEPVDDHDMSAVNGVTVLSAEDVSGLAADHGAASDRLDPYADWSAPVSIFVELEPLSWECETGQWAREVADAVSRATTELIAESVDAVEAVERLFVLGREGVEMAEAMEGTAKFDPMRQVLNTLHRRVNLWEEIAAASQAEMKPRNWSGFTQAVERMRRQTNHLGGEAWNEFLELDRLAEMATRAPEDWNDEDRTTARVVILKLRVADLTEEQRVFLSSKEVTDLEASLADVATEPIDAGRLVRCVEAFERTRSPIAAEFLAIERLKLSLSTLPAQVGVSDCIQEFYCGPNVRIAVTGYLLNRMMPDREPEYQWVRDTVLGHPVRGRSLTSAEIGLALIPDDEQMRAAVTVDGLVEAETSSTAGPARFFTDSDSAYSAVKEMRLTPMGIHFAPAEVSVENEMRLRQIRTDFDGIPLLGSLVSSVARSQHEKSRLAIRYEMNRKVKRQAARQIDEEIDARLGELNDRLKYRLLDPLAAMSLRPEVAEAKTTASRMSMQLRLAGPSQLGSHTPRPWAPSDSVLSFQLHQSAVNNVLTQLKLDGATLTIKELRERIAQRFNRPEMLEQTTDNDDVEIAFAARDAARVDFEDGRIAISLGISRLRAGARQWRDFRVRAYYGSEMSECSASMTRDGVVELIGRLRTGSQIALRGIFSKVFAKDVVWPIVPDTMTADPRLQGLEVTQLNIDNGWFGLAVGPERIQPAMAIGPSDGRVK
jgi:hypothetical protein